MKNMHIKVHFNDEKYLKYYFKIIVHKGSPISPALFNLEEFLQELKREFNPIDFRKIWYKAYAED